MSLSQERRAILSNNWERVNATIRRLETINTNRIQLIAVSKTRTWDEILALYELGARDFGENYAQELSAKAITARDAGLLDIRWHMIGHLQTNKIKMILPHVSCLHTLDSLKLAAKLNESFQRLPVFIEVNVSGEPTKSGIAKEGLVDFVHSLKAFQSLDIRGLMAIPSAENPKSGFDTLASLNRDLGPLTAGELSMGMSDDYEQALESGATHLRIGTALFGPRVT